MQAAITLTRLASEVSRVFEVFHFDSVQHAVTKYKQQAVTRELMMFLVFVCHGHDLSSSEKVNYWSIILFVRILMVTWIFKHFYVVGR